MNDSQNPTRRGRAQKFAAFIMALTPLVAAVVPPIVSTLRSPTVTVTASGPGSTAAGRDVNTVNNFFVSFADRWVDGVKTIFNVASPSQRPDQGKQTHDSPATSAPIASAAVAAPAQSLATNTDGEVRVGKLVLRFANVEIAPTPGSAPDSQLQAIIGIDFTNTGSTPLRLAMVPQWPVLQVEGGIQFDIRPYGVKGLDTLNLHEVSACQGAAENFSLLRPGQTFAASLIFDTNLKGRKLPDVRFGRVSGMLMVYSVEDKSCAREPFTASRLPATVYR